jgi:hypothetical protein
MATAAPALPIAQEFGGHDMTTCNAFFSAKHGLGNSF